MRAVLFSLFLWAAHISGVSAKPNVVFFNPGASSEFFWVGFTDFMHAAATQLDMELEVFYAERQPEQTLAQVREVLARKQLPDYLIITNENYIAPEVLRLAQGTSAKIFIVHNQLTPEQQIFTGAARERHSNWIGTVTCNNEEAGYLTGKGLLDLDPIDQQGSKELVAISGSRQTPVSQERVEGLKRAVSEYSAAQLRQVVHGDWRADRSEVQTVQLMKRYPNVRLIWSASDEMAFGAMQAMTRQGLVAGQDYHVSAMNNSERVLNARITGEISVLAAGHFTLGGYSLVMIHDYEKGKDFKNYGGLSQSFELLQLIDKEEAATLLKRIQNRDYAIDFKAFSATHPNFTGRYQFSLAPLLVP